MSLPRCRARSRRTDRQRPTSPMEDGMRHGDALGTPKQAWRSPAFGRHTDTNGP